MISNQTKNRLKRKSIGHNSYGKCVICRKEGPLEVDHIIPKSKGGTDHILNLQLLCRRCNAKKGSKVIGNKSMGGEMK